jgi:hypothetical protein
MFITPDPSRDRGSTHRLVLALGVRGLVEVPTLEERNRPP